MNVAGHRVLSSEGEETDNIAVQPSIFTASEAAFDAAFLRLQTEVDHQPDVQLTRRSTLDSRAPLVALLRAAAERIMCVYFHPAFGLCSHDPQNTHSGSRPSMARNFKCNLWPDMG